MFFTNIPFSFLDIVPVTLRAVPAPPHVPRLGPLPLCPAPLPGGGGIRIPPLALAHGVAPGHDLIPLRNEDSGVEAAARTGMVYESQSSRWSSVQLFNSNRCLTCSQK